MERKEPGYAGDIRPVPDPTLLTTQALTASVFALRELLEARMIGMERDIARLQGSVNDVPEGVAKMIAALEALHNEKFRGIDTQFRERDTRIDQSSKDTKVAVDAALQAAEKAVGKQQESFALATSKSEAATMKQIDQMTLNVQATTNSLNDKIEDVKGRLSSLKDDVMNEIVSLRESNSRGSGADNQAALGRANSQWLVGLIVSVILGASAIAAAVIFKN